MRDWRAGTTGPGAARRGRRRRARGGGGVQARGRAGDVNTASRAELDLESRERHAICGCPKWGLAHVWLRYGLWSAAANANGKGTKGVARDCRSVSAPRSGVSEG
eukprot:4494845-Prymnesium_polylepis.1